MLFSQLLWSPCSVPRALCLLENLNQPSEFKLLVEERRIIESVCGNENLEIQWRLATLKEAKVVAAHYLKYLKENSLIKSVYDPEILPPEAKPPSSWRASANLTITSKEKGSAHRGTEADPFPQLTALRQLPLWCARANPLNAIRTECVP